MGTVYHECHVEQGAFCHHALNHRPLNSIGNQESSTLSSIHIIRNPEDITRFPVCATLITRRSFEYEHKNLSKSRLGKAGPERRHITL
jgi:hypothetical protein